MAIKTLSAFVVDGKITVHHSGCQYVIREWRNSGTPVVAHAESVIGLTRQLRSKGIRTDDMRVMGCAKLPEGFWSRTPGGENLRLLSTEYGARTATRRLERQVASELKTAVDNMSPYLREALGLTR